MKKKSFCIFLISGFQFVFFFLPAQQRIIDSLQIIVKTEKEDTNKVKNLITLSKNFRFDDAAKALNYSQQALSLSEKINFQEGIADSWYNFGIIYVYQKNYAKALEYTTQTIQLCEKITYKLCLGNAYNMAGNIFYLKLNYAEAIKYYLKSLKISEDLGDKNRVAITSTNIGSFYYEQKNYKQALYYHFKALKLQEGNHWAMLYPLRGIANTYMALGKSDSAFFYFDKCVAYSKELNVPLELGNTYSDVATAYAQLNNYKKAYEYSQLYVVANDSFYSLENSKQITEMSAKYESQKKEQQIQLLNKEKEKQAVIAEEKNRQKNSIIFSVAIVLLLALLFSAFVFRSLQTSRRQKMVIEEKQKEILDSIHYAKRIQKSLLPTEKYIGRNLNRLNS
ncbi:MAG: tetratricopeptide repeat protein [Bacteroidetes bacterium]|nr:tetratricopeptide repeat protein [Bacteroidota bacterium]